MDALPADMLREVLSRMTVRERSRVRLTHRDALCASWPLSNVDRLDSVAEVLVFEQAMTMWGETWKVAEMRVILEKTVDIPALSRAVARHAETLITLKISVAQGYVSVEERRTRISFFREIVHMHFPKLEKFTFGVWPSHTWQNRGSGTRPMPKLRFLKMSTPFCVEFAVPRLCDASKLERWTLTDVKSGSQPLYRCSQAGLSMETCDARTLLDIIEMDGKARNEGMWQLIMKRVCPEVVDYIWKKCDNAVLFGDAACHGELERPEEWRVWTRPGLFYCESMEEFATACLVLRHILTFREVGPATWTQLPAGLSQKYLRLLMMSNTVKNLIYYTNGHVLRSPDIVRAALGVEDFFFSDLPLQPSLTALRTVVENAKALGLSYMDSPAVQKAMFHIDTKHAWLGEALAHLHHAGLHHACDLIRRTRCASIGATCHT